METGSVASTHCSIQDLSVDRTTPEHLQLVVGVTEYLLSANELLKSTDRK